MRRAVVINESLFCCCIRKRHEQDRGRQEKNLQRTEDLLQCRAQAQPETEKKQKQGSEIKQDKDVILLFNEARISQRR